MRLFYKQNWKQVLKLKYLQKTFSLTGKCVRSMMTMRNQCENVKQCLNICIFTVILWKTSSLVISLDPSCGLHEYLKMVARLKLKTGSVLTTNRSPGTIFINCK